MLRVIRYHKANGYDHSKVPLLKRGDRIQLEDGSHRIYGGSHGGGGFAMTPSWIPLQRVAVEGPRPRASPRRRPSIDLRGRPLRAGGPSGRRRATFSNALQNVVVPSGITRQTW